MTATNRTAITEHAPAKINLTLEVLGRRPDGYHELASLVAFASVGDTLELYPGEAWSLACSGPTAGAIAGPNLVERAARAVTASWPDGQAGRIVLHKLLPVAAGIGGGSADAAATLRAYRRLIPGRLDESGWMRIAVGLGADVPVCYVGKLAFMSGLGERITPLPLKIKLPAVLVNPGVALSTARVFADLAAPPIGSAVAAGRGPDFRTQAELVAWVVAGGNHLEVPALRLAPVVGRVRAALQAAPGCLVARLSGSGPTCFGLFETTAAAQAAAEGISGEQPDWWVQAVELG